MAILNGTTGSDLLRGTSLKDTIDGKGGNDTLYGNAGDDSLIGGPGNDFIYGGDGNDTVNAASGDGSDHIYGDKGRDIYNLSAGDVIHYSSYQQSGSQYGYDFVRTLNLTDRWTIDFTGFDANLLVPGQQHLSWGAGIGQLHVIRGGIFNLIWFGLGANLDNDPELEFRIDFVAYYQHQSLPNAIF
jgi:Ca2+-binding RTX toxin-like protein